MRRFLRELHEIKTEERYRSSLWFLRAFCLAFGAFWLWFGYVFSNWVGEASWAAIITGFGPVTVMSMTLALLSTARLTAFGLGVLGGAVLLVPLLPTNEWKAINIKTRGLRLGMSSDDACAIIGNLEPNCLNLAAKGESVFLVPTNDPSNNSAYVRVEFFGKMVAAIERSPD